MTYLSEDRVTDLFHAVRGLSPGGVSALVRDALRIADVPDVAEWKILGGRTGRTSLDRPNRRAAFPLSSWGS